MTKAQELRWKAELEIIQELGRIPSSREMTKLLKEKKGITVNHNTVNSDLKRDLESLTESEYTNQKSGILSMLDNLIEIADGIATSDPDNKLKLQAMNTVTKLSKTKSDVLIKFRKANAELHKQERPIYEVTVGEPKTATNEELDEKDIEKAKELPSSNKEGDESNE